MTEIKKTLSILKARWPEVTLIMGLYLLRLLYYPLFGSVGRRLLTPDKLALLALPMSYLLLAISATLRFGFLRTVYLQGNQRSSPLTLLRTGIYFLWRMVVLGALYSILFLLVTLLSARIIAELVSPESFAQIGFWINQLFFLAFSVILVKLILLLPALVIVLDCRTFESFKFLKHCRLWEAKELVILFYAHLAFRFLLRFLRLHYDIPTASRYILEIGPLIISCFVNLIIAVMAVRFVASLHLEYNSQPVSLDFEDLHKCQK